MVRYLLMVVTLTILAACGGSQGNEQTAVQIPSAPKGITAVGGPDNIVVSWSPVTGATSYNLYWTDTPGLDPRTGTKISGVTSPSTISGLTIGVTYGVTVTAENSAGESGTTGHALTQVGRPARVTGVSATAGDGRATVQWNTQADATGFTLYWSTTGRAGTDSNAIQDVSSPFTVTGLSNGVSHSFVVAAVNGAVEGTVSQFVTATPAALVDGWSAQTQISIPVFGFGADALPYEVAINDSGVAAAAWLTLDGPNGVVQRVTVNFTTNGVWGEQIHLESGNAIQPSIAVTPNGDIFVAYRRSSSTIWSRWYRDGNWSEPVRIDSMIPRLYKYNATLAADGQGNVLVAWQERVPLSGGTPEEFTTEVWVRRFEASTDSWSAAEVVGTSVRDVRSIVMGADGTNRAVLAWLQDTQPYDTAQADGGPEQRVVYASGFDGISWRPATAVGRDDLTGSDSAEELSLDVNDIGSAVAAWTQSRFPDGQDPFFQLDTQRYDSLSGQWATAAVVAESARTITSPGVAIDGADQRIVAWFPTESNSDVMDRIDASIYDTGTASWDAIQTIAAAFNNLPGIAFGIEKEVTGASVVVWAIERNDIGLFVRRSDTSSTIWGDVNLLGGRVGRVVKLAMSRNGRAIVAVDATVVQNERFERLIYANTYAP